jgi:hypothetical protein
MEIKHILQIFVALLFLVPVSYSTFVRADDQPFVLKWSTFTNVIDYDVSPLAVDVNHDGVMEVFVSGPLGGGGNKIFCLYGNNGTVKWSVNSQFGLAGHNPMLIYDLNKDGKYELVQPCPSGLEVLDADTGALIWKNASIKCSEAHQLVLDTDGTGYPYIYTCNASDTGGAKLRKVDGRTGKALISKDIWYPCHGGLAAADVNGDGHYEIFMTDRSTGQGKGIQCYDAGTLDLLWSRPDIFCSSHPPVIADVNNDGTLDVVVLQQNVNNAGIYCVNGTTGNNIPGKCQGSITGLAAHEAFPLYDIDGDGHLELCTCSYSLVKVFDLGTWQIEATLGMDGKPPYFANVMGDTSLEIILSEEANGIKIYNNQYQFLYNISGYTSQASIVQDIDGDGLNELISISDNGTVRAYNTLAVAPNPLPRTNIVHYSERNTRAAVYIPQPGEEQDYPPLLQYPSPSNQSAGVSITTANVSINIHDPEGKAFNYSITTSPNVGSVSVNGAHNGTKVCALSGLSDSTTYHWYVKAFDGYQWTNKSYYFTTQSQDTIPPQISNILRTTSNPLDTNPTYGWVNVSCTVTDNVAVSQVILKSKNPSGSWNNVSMTTRTTGKYYYRSNTAFSNAGNYTYYIWAKDTNNNGNISNAISFSMTPNWDMNNDGRCTILDQVIISVHYGTSGSPGWIREDVDNNGAINILDLIAVSNYYGDLWWN